MADPLSDDLAGADKDGVMVFIDWKGRFVWPTTAEPGDRQFLRKKGTT